MRCVVKRAQEPEALLRERKSNIKSSTWDSLSGGAKDSIRSALVDDQRGLCCYCMKRIGRTSMKVEHYRSQSKHPDEALVWKNLLGACSGNEGGPWHQQTCDTRKGDTDLTVDPLRDVTLRDLRFLADGRILGKSPAIEADLNERLNLNFAQLCENRKEALSALQTVLEIKYGRHTSWTKSDLEKELERIRQKDPYPPFVGVLEDWLVKLVRKR